MIKKELSLKIYYKRKKSLLHWLCSGTSVFFNSLLIEQGWLDVFQGFEIAFVRRFLLPLLIALQPRLVTDGAERHPVRVGDESTSTLGDETLTPICLECADRVVMVIGHQERCCSQRLRWAMALALVVSHLWLSLPQPQVTVTFLLRSVIAAAGRGAHLVVVTTLTP